MSTSILGTWNVWWLNDPLHHQPPPPPEQVALERLLAASGTWSPRAVEASALLYRGGVSMEEFFRRSLGIWSFPVLLPGLVGLGIWMEMDGFLFSGKCQWTEDMKDRSNWHLMEGHPQLPHLKAFLVQTIIFGVHVPFPGHKFGD